MVATPIGNLSDITLRAIQTLRAAHWIACEDTRHTRPLLAHHGIEGRLLAVHQHNEAAAAEGILEKLAAGESVALVTDAGTPAVSDPGARLVARIREAGYSVMPIPGPSAVVTALSAAGIAEGPFAFIGFLPAKSAARRRAIQKFASCPAALVFYEAPHRVLETIADLAEELGGARPLVIAKELTKLFETFHACRLDAAAEWFAADANRLRGEFVLIIGAPEQDDSSKDADSERVLRLLLDDDLPVKQAAGLAAQIAGGNKKALYDLALQWKRNAENAQSD